MIRKESLNHLLRSDTSRSLRAANGLFCAEPLELVLQRERARSDRTGQVFSLLVFHLAPEHVRQGGETHLASILARRLRIMDYLGPLGASLLGVVLPETSPNGAQTLADYVEREFAGVGSLPRYEIFAYPTQAAPDDADPRDGRYGRAPGGGENCETSGSPDQSAVPSTNGCERISPMSSRARCGTTSS